MEHLLNYPGPWEWIRTGLEPTYPTPSLKISGEIQPREAQVGGRGRGNGAGRGVAVRRGRGGRQGRGIFDVLDEDDEENVQDQIFREEAAQVRMVRNPIYMGEEGKEDWRETLRSNKRMLERHKRDKYLAWGFLMKHVDNAIKDKIVIINNYDMHYANHNILFFWNALREIATGIGAQSAGVVLSKALKLQLVNDGWSKYFKEVKDARRAFDRLNIPPEQLKDVLWNSIFMIGMSAEGNTILRTELDNVMSQQVWPDMDQLIGRWTIMLTAKDTMCCN